MENRISRKMPECHKFKKKGYFVALKREKWQYQMSISFGDQLYALMILPSDEKCHDKLMVVQCSFKLI